MDEVFFIADPFCPRCRGRDPADLFAGEARALRDHLADKKRSLWIWGDRLIEGAVSGINLWEASYNNTHRAIDLLPKDILICDWHYGRPHPTAPYFAMKGFNVVSSPWNDPAVAVAQVDDMVRLRANSSDAMQARFRGVLHTVWSDAGPFLDEFYGRKPAGEGSQAGCFRAMFDEIKKVSSAQ